MNSETVKQAEELKEMAKLQQSHPFPYADCRKIHDMSGNRDESFIPDLDTYFYDLWSVCHGINHLLRRPFSEIEAARQYFTVPLPERYVRYKPLFVLASQESTPDLYHRLEECARMKQKLLDILALHLEDQELMAE